MITKNKPLIDVVLYVWGDLLNSDDISSRLGVEPVLSRRKGEKRISRTQREITAQTGVWTLDTSRSDELSVHIQELANKVNSRASQVNTIAGVEGAYVDIYVGVATDDYGNGEYKVQLGQQDLDALRKIGLPVELTIDVVKK